MASTSISVKASSNKTIVQSLHDKQVLLVRGIKMGNAYAVWQRLHDNYGIIVSAASKHSLLSSLMNNRKLSSETVSDYFARTDRIINDIDVLNDKAMDDSTKRFHYLNGLAHDEKWSKLATLLTQVDTDEKWSLEKVKQYFYWAGERRSVTERTGERVVEAC
jgi:hypothetical protein